MKKILILLFFISLQNAHAQTVMSSAGAINTSNGASVSYTIGETLVQTVVNNAIVTQGFQQAKPKLSTPVADNNEVLDFGIYPNPTLALLYIKNSANIKQIEVFNDLGQQLFSSNTPNESIDFSNYPNGIYFLKIKTTSDKFFTQQVVKQ